MVVAPVGADTESSVNERIPISSQELEQHWRIDCNAGLHKLDNLLAAIDQNRQPVAAEHLELYRKCALIYNTSGTANYSPCVDYKLIFRQLNRANSLVAEKQDFNPAQIRSILAPLKKITAENSCQ